MGKAKSYPCYFFIENVDDVYKSQIRRIVAMDTTRKNANPTFIIIVDRASRATPIKMAWYWRFTKLDTNWKRLDP